MKPPPHARPYWHVDAKWICGILFAAGLALSLSLYILSVVTSERVAVPVATHIAAGMFSRNGLDDASELEEFKQKARQQPGDKVETLPGVFISKTDMETLPPKELRLKIFRQVVEPYYQLGAKGVAAKQTSDPVQQANIERQAGPLALINKQAHQDFQRLFLVSLALLILPLAGLVFFSAGFGRLVSPGIILASATLPAAVAAGIFEIAKRSSKPVGDAAQSGPLPPEAMQLIAAAVLPGFVIVFAVGALLLLGAAIGKIVTKRRAKAAA